MSRTLLLLSTAVLWVASVSGQDDLRRPPLCPRILCRPQFLSCPTFDYDAVYDLENSQVTPNQYIQAVVPITGQGCSSQGVFKLVLASRAQDANRRRILIDFFFNNPTGWVFNLGDSSTNNGYAGDGSTQSWDAEIHGNTRGLSGYLSDVGGSGQAFNQINLYSNRLTLVVGNGHLSWLADNKVFNYYSNQGLFGLNGQPDSTGPVNYDLYLGLNRVISGPSDRTGSGLCKVGLKFLPET